MPTGGERENSSKLNGWAGIIDRKARAEQAEGD